MSTSAWLPADGSPPEPVEGEDVVVPSIARVYDYLLGGRDNFQVDRDAAEEVIAVFPHIRDTALGNRETMRRGVEYLSSIGINQFLDVGTGIPTSTTRHPNVHQIAQGIHQDARVVYVDNDPIVLQHARKLMNGPPEGRTDFIDADMRFPAKVLREAARTLDFSQPVGLLLIAVLHFIRDDEQAAQLVKELAAGLPAGSHVMITHGTGDFTPRAEVAANVYRRSGLPITLRGRAQVLRLFGDLELVGPGLVPGQQWRVDKTPLVSGGPATNMYAGVARKYAGLARI